jgi:hypothetical protein
VDLDGMIGRDQPLRDHLKFAKGTMHGPEPPP